MADVDPGDHELGMSLREQGRLGDNLVNRPRTARPTGQTGRAKGTLAITTVLNLQPTAGGTLSLSQQRTANRFGVEAIQITPKFELDQGARLRRLRDLNRVMASHDPDNAGHLRVFIGTKGGGTTRYDDARVGTLAMQASHEAPRLSIGLIGDRARIDDHEIGLVRTLNRLRAPRLELLAHALGIVLVRLTAEGVVVNAHEPR